MSSVPTVFSPTDKMYLICSKEKKFIFIQETDICGASHSHHNKKPMPTASAAKHDKEVRSSAFILCQ